jgi:UPF0716 family protein affecting phage T7 exclusion
MARLLSGLFLTAVFMFAMHEYSNFIWWAYAQLGIWFLVVLAAATFIGGLLLHRWEMKNGSLL